MDAPKPNRNLTEISHLFLSSVRDKQTAGMARPKRTPPPAITARPAVSVDLTPEEFAEVYAGQLAVDSDDANESDVRIPPMTAVIASHLNKPSEQIKQYARHLAAGGKRIGVLEVDASAFRLMCFEPAEHQDAAESPEPTPIEHFDAREMGNALEEMSWDLDRWLIVLPNPRTTEARNMLRIVENWVLLSTWDHDGVVAGYRTLKGLSDLPMPKLSLAVLDAKDDEQAERVYHKLANVCQQFLSWSVQMEEAVQAAPDTAEHVVMNCRPIHDKAQLASATQWKVLASFLSRAANQSPGQPNTNASVSEPKMIDESEHIALAEHDAEPAPVILEMPKPAPVPAASIPCANSARGREHPSSPHRSPGAPMAIAAQTSSPVTTMDEVLELPDTNITESSILSAIIRHAQAGLIECPVHPPMCPEARLAVTRDRGLVMLAVARQGLTELRSIGQAYRWLVENRALIGMAVPQLSIDALQHPRLRLLVDHIDLTAELLQPMLEARTVTVQAYRKLRWGAKTGLLLEAA